MMKVFCFVIIVTGLNRSNIGKNDVGGGGSDNDYDSLEFIIISYSWSYKVTFQH